MQVLKESLAGQQKLQAALIAQGELLDSLRAALEITAAELDSTRATLGPVLALLVRTLRHQGTLSDTAAREIFAWIRAKLDETANSRLDSLYGLAMDNG